MCVTVWVLRYKNKKNGDRGTIVFTATLRFAHLWVDWELSVGDVLNLRPVSCVTAFYVKFDVEVILRNKIKTQNPKF